MLKRLKDSTSSKVNAAGNSTLESEFRLCANCFRYLSQSAVVTTACASAANTSMVAPMVNTSSSVR